MIRFLSILGLGALLLLAPMASGQVEKKKKLPDAVVDDPKLPRVLIIGDSISIGYTPFVRDLLKGKANVHHNAGNAQDTKNGVAKLKDWLGSGKWDVIHVNFGLHDIKMGTGSHQVPIEEYEKNLRSIAKDLKATGAKILWCSTTPVPKEEQKVPRRTDDVVKYNAVAKKVMDEAAIPINDLYAYAQPQIKEIQLPANVHFHEAGSKKLAEPVAAAILKALGK